MTQSPLSHPKGVRSLLSTLCSPIPILIVVCLIALVPLLRSASPCTHDGGLHYFRVAAMRHALEQGLFFTRWLPDLAFGYGFPFFNYRAFLSYYLALGLHLAGLPLPLALNLVYVLSILGCALGAYLLARDLFGPLAGIVAAAAYAYAPYQFLDAFVRGNAPESVALALLPFVLWAFRRLALEGGRRWFLASVGLLAALYLDHNISSLLFTPLLLTSLGVLGWIYRRPRRREWIALALALGLVAFLWLPALAERSYVQLYLTRANRNNDFHYNFLSLTEIFAPPTPLDTSLMNPPLEIHLGLAQVVLAGLGLVFTGWQVYNAERASPQRRACKSASLRERWATSVFFALAAAVMVFMSTKASVWLWEHVPLLPFIQFPWRLVGRAALPVALLAGASVPAIIPSGHASPLRVMHLASCILVSILILAAFPSTYPTQGYCPMPPRPTILDVHQYEQKRVGVDPVGAYFPIWVQRRPEGSPLETQYAATGSVARFDETALPEEAMVLEAQYGPNRARLTVESPLPFRTRYLTFYFPGWRVWVDGEPVEAIPSDPEGLITFDVPAGRHTVAIRFGETPLRLAADVISLFSLILLLGLALRYPDAPDPKPKAQELSPATYGLLFIILLGFKLAIVDQTKTPFRRPSLRPDGTLPDIELALNQSYADGLTLIGYDQNDTSLPADGTLRLDLYWTAHAKPSASYKTVVHLVGPDGQRWSMHDSFRPRGYNDYPPTTTWDPDRYALDSHQVEPLPGAPPGDYDIVLTVFERDTLAPLSALNEQDQPTAPNLLLGQVTLTALRRPTDPDQLGIRHRRDARLGPLTLLGADFDRDEAAPGDPVFVTTFWRVEEQPVEEPTLQLELVAPDGSLATQYDFFPVAPWHPTHRWQIDDVWRGQHLFHLPAALDSGDYVWRISNLQISRPKGFHVTAPDRNFAPPPVKLELDTRLENTATLLGANLETGANLTVTLVWRAESETHVSYRVFLHLIGPNGRLLAQSDGIPASWNRPTTGWVAGEYITDEHVLAIPPDAPAGEYELIAGMYVSGGERLTTSNGSDSVPLTTLTLGGE